MPLSLTLLYFSHHFFLPKYPYYPRLLHSPSHPPSCLKLRHHARLPFFMSLFRILFSSPSCSPWRRIPTAKLQRRCTLEVNLPLHLLCPLLLAGGGATQRHCTLEVDFNEVVADLVLAAPKGDADTEMQCSRSVRGGLATTPSSPSPSGHRPCWWPPPIAASSNATSGVSGAYGSAAIKHHRHGLEMMAAAMEVRESGEN